MSEASALGEEVSRRVQGPCSHLSSPSLPGIKNADHKELIRVASMPTDAFFFYVGDFKLLGTLVPLMTRRVCTSVGGTLRLLGMGPHPPLCGARVPAVLSARMRSPWVHP